MSAKYEISMGIKNSTINGYPSEDNLCVIKGNDGKNDIVVNIFVEPDGKLVIETNNPEAIDIRHGEIRKSLPATDFFQFEESGMCNVIFIDSSCGCIAKEKIHHITGGCSLPSDESLRNHIRCC
ncbi:hypothetical protein ACRFDV_11955 [Klebsiella pneumoniae]